MTYIMCAGDDSSSSASMTLSSSKTFASSDESDLSLPSEEPPHLCSFTSWWVTILTRMCVHGT